MGRNKPRKYGYYDNCDINKSRGSCTKKVRTDSSCSCGLDVFLPQWLPWVIVCVTMVIRINYVTQAENSWILHPDEIYQSVEVAFSEVYGYGFRPYEYLPPPGFRNTSIDQQHTQSGMFALRSFMFPRIFSLVLYLAKFLGWDSNPLMICKILNAGVTSLLPYTTFLFTRKLFRCHTAGVLSCALVLSGLHLSIICTHTLVNGFVAPFLFLGLTMCIPSQEQCLAFRQIKTTFENSRHYDTLSDCNRNTVLNRHDRHFTYCGSDKDEECFDKQSGNHAKNEKGLHQNGNIVNGHCSVNNDAYQNGVKHTEDTRKKKERLTESINVSITLNRSMYMLGGSLLGLMCYIRADNLLFCSFTLLPLYLISISNVKPSYLIRKLIWISLGVTGIFIICVVDDFVQYGGLYVSPIQWFKFNILSGQAMKLFRSDNINSYFTVLCPDMLNAVLHTCLAAVVLVDVLCITSERDWQRKMNFVATLLSFLLLYIVYSYFGHKEIRFMFNGFVLLSVLISYAMHTILIWLRKLNVKRYTVVLIACTVLSGLSLNTYQNFPSAGHATNSGLSHGDAEESKQVNVCLDMIGQTDDVTGVFVNSSIFNMAGFTILRRNVPLWVKLHNEYHLYNTTSDNRLNNNSGIKIIGDFSDFIHRSNTFDIIQMLSRDRTLNYVITETKLDKVSKNLPYKRKAKCGNFALFKRYSTTNTLSRRQIESMASPPSPEVLEYEASWLITNGLFSKAISRIQRAFDEGGSRVRLYQQLAYSYAYIGRSDKVPVITELCHKRHGAEECARSQEKVVLDKQYNRLD